MDVILFAVVPLTDDQLLLNNLVRSVLIIVGLLAATKFVMSGGGATAKIANATQGIAKQFGVDKGLDKTGSRVRALAGWGAKGAMKTGAKGARYGGRRAYNSRPARHARGRVAGSAIRARVANIGGSSFKARIARAAIANAAGKAWNVAKNPLDNARAVGVALDSRSDNIKNQKRARALGVVGQSELLQSMGGGGSAMAGLAGKALKEAMEAHTARLQASINKGDMSQMAEAVRAAIEGGDEAQIRAAYQFANSAGGAGREAIAQATAAAVGGAALSPETAQAVSKARDDIFPDLRDKRPDMLTQTIGTPLTASGAATTQPPNSLKDGQIATMDAEARTAAIADGVIDLVQAQRVARSDVARQTLTQAQLNELDPTVSDIRLKKNIVKLATQNGFNLYKFNYLWSDETYVGIMAQDILETHPHAISKDTKGFYRVNYAQLGLQMQTYESWLNNKR